MLNRYEAPVRNNVQLQAANKMFLRCSATMEGGKSGVKKKKSNLRYNYLEMLVVTQSSWLSYSSSKKI